MAGRRLLVVRFSALGDVAMTIPVIYSVARAYPDDEIIVATRPFFARLFVNTPSNLKVIPFDLDKDYRGLAGTARLIRETVRLHPTHVADLHDVARSWCIANVHRLLGAKVESVDKQRGSRKEVFGGGTPQRQYIERYFDVFKHLGFAARPDFRSIYCGMPVPDPGIETIAPSVGIAPFARYANKTYPPEKMREVAISLAHKGYAVYLFGGRGKEAETLRGWEGPGIVSVAGKLPIESELALMSHLDLMVSMDSANQHLAALTGCKVLTIWGSTTPACGFVAFGQTVGNALCLSLPCQPCTIAGSPRCPLGHLACMNDIAPSLVVEKIERMIETHPRNDIVKKPLSN